MNKIRFVYRYINYLFKATNAHGVHSPFFVDLLQVIYVKHNYYHYGIIERLRKQLLSSDKTISYLDLGAGGQGGKATEKKIKELAQRSAKPAKYGQLLFRLVNYLQPVDIIELGTSLGLSTAYMAAANSKTHLTTIEGSGEVAAIAKTNFKQLKLKNITQVTGNFNDVLPRELAKTDKVGIVFFDGNHLKNPTINYFNWCLQKAGENSVFIFDDIYWSDEMAEAWAEIKNNEKVTITIDLFFMGLVFFKKEQPKQHFVIRF